VFFRLKEIRFFGKIGFLTGSRNPIFWKNRISNRLKKSDFLEKSDFSPAQEIRFFGKIGFLTGSRNPIFWKNRISNRLKKSDFLEKSDFS